MTAIAILRRPPRLRRLLAGILVLLLLAGAAWGAGFLWFVRNAVQPMPMPPVADGIVALTGGADRVATALKLRADGRARLLLVSGVARGTDFAEIAHTLKLNPAPLKDRVTLGHNAISTAGNAQEAAAWAQANGIHTLIVVTAGYHMPRALTEISRALPDVTLYPVPVVPPALRDPEAASTLRLLAAEYTKWLAADLGLSRFFHARDSG